MNTPLDLKETPLLPVNQPETATSATVNLEKLAEKIYRLLTHELKVEKERTGRQQDEW